jgi:hypothetical protein
MELMLPFVGKCGLSKEVITMSGSGNESNVYSKLYEFAATQIFQSCDFFEKAYKIALRVLLLIAVVVIGVFYWLLGQKYTDIEATITRKTDEQLGVLQQQILKRVEDEFRTCGMSSRCPVIKTELLRYISGCRRESYSLRWILPRDCRYLQSPLCSRSLE